MIKSTLTRLSSPPVPSFDAVTAEGRELAKHFGTSCIETSAKQRVNVDEAFMMLVRNIRKYNKETNPAAPTKQQTNEAAAAGGGGGHTPLKQDSHGGGCCSGCVVL